MTPGARDEVFALAHEIRGRGGVVDLDQLGRSPKGQMKQAGRSGARYALIVGDQELASGLVTVRDLETGQERSVSRTEAVRLAAGEGGATGSGDVKTSRAEDRK
jgi:histidyl-tRNA synthetase